MDGGGEAGARPAANISQAAADAAAEIARALGITRPIVFFDLETTGVNVELDRVIELGVVKLHPEGWTVAHAERFNPGMPIPPSATAIHGITDADVADKPTFQQRAKAMFRGFDGCDLGGFNASKFDRRMLKAEFARFGIEWPAPGTRTVDAMRIFHDRHPRDLSAAVRLYLGREHEGAHGAVSDISASVEVLAAQLRAHPDLPRDIDALARVGRSPEWIDEEGKLVWRDGAPRLAVGKHSGRTLREVLAIARDYFDWMLRSDFPADTKAIVRRVLAGVLPGPPVALCGPGNERAAGGQVPDGSDSLPPQPGAAAEVMDNGEVPSRGAVS